MNPEDRIKELEEKVAYEQLEKSTMSALFSEAQQDYINRDTKQKDKLRKAGQTIAVMRGALIKIAAGDANATELAKAALEVLAREK